MMQKISKSSKLLLIVLLVTLLVAGIAVCTTTALVSGETPGTAYADTQLTADDMNIIKQYWKFGASIICVIPKDSSGNNVANDVYLGSRKINNPTGQNTTDHTAYGNYALEHVSDKNKKYVIYRWDSEAIWHMTQVVWRSTTQGDFFLNAPTPNRPTTEIVHVWNIVNGFPVMFKDTQGNVYISPDGQPVASSSPKIYLSPDGMSTTPGAQFDLKKTVDENGELNVTIATLNPYSATYTGSSITPPLISTLSKYHLSIDPYRTCEISETNAGEYTFYVKPDTDYYWKDGTNTSRKVTWKITAADISNATITVPEVKADGIKNLNAEPEVTVKIGKTTFTKDDFTFEYSNNSEPGQGKVTITAKNSNLIGSVTKTFNIVFDMSKATATIADSDSFKYNGSAQTPSPTVTVGEETLDEGTHYTLEYSDNKDAGQATVTVKGKAPFYTGSVTTTFTIAPASLTDVTATLKNGGKVQYTGEAVTLSAEDFTDLYIGGYTLTDDDITIEISESAIQPGHYTATLKGAENSNFDINSQKTVDFDIVLDLKDANVELENATGHTYNGTEIKPDVTKITLANGTELEGETLTRLLANYDVTYANNTNAGEATVTISPKTEGGDSTHYTGTTSATFEIAKKTLDNYAVTIENKDGITYDNTAKTPVTIKDGDKDVTEYYDIEYSNNTNAGTATFTATAKEESNYAGTIEGEFTINKAKWSAEDLKGKIQHTPEKLGTAANSSVKFELPEGVTLALKNNDTYKDFISFKNNTLTLGSIPESGIDISKPIEFTITVESQNFELDTSVTDEQKTCTVDWEFTEGFLVEYTTAEGKVSMAYPTLAAALATADKAENVQDDVTVTVKTSKEGLVNTLTNGVTLSGTNNITVKAAEGNAIVKVQADDAETPYITLNGSGTLTFDGVTLQGTDGNDGICPATFADVKDGTLAFTNATVSGFAGALTASAGNITASGTTFSGNKTTNGGAINATGATVTLTNCTFTGNSATKADTEGGLGGAIYASNTALNITGGTFEKNTATEGGAIYVDNSAAEGKNVAVNSGIFKENSAEQGGAIYFNGTGDAAQLVIGEGGEGKPQFTSNLATQNGGAIYVAGGTAEVKAADVSNNSAEAGIGDGVYLAGNIESADNSAKLTLNASNAATDEFKDGIGVEGLSTITVNGDIADRTNKFTVEFGDELIAKAGDDTVKGHKFVTSGEGGANETQLKAQFRVANPGYTFDPQSGASALGVTSTGDMFVYVQTSAGTYQGFNSVETAFEAANSAEDKTLYFTVNITYTGSEITNVTYEQEIDKTMLISAVGDGVTLKTLVRVANRTDDGSLEYFTDDDAFADIDTLKGDLKGYFATAAEKPEWFNSGTDTVEEPAKWDFVVKRGQGFTAEMLKVEAGATATIDDVIFDGGAVWECGHPSISDDGNGGAGTVTTNNNGLTAHAPAIVNQGTLTLEAGCVVRNNDNNNAKPGEGFGSQYYGGGVRNEGAGNLTVNGATIKDNYAREGGGILNINKYDADWDGETYETSVTITGETKIQYNASQMKGAAVQTIYGGATTTVEGGTIENNFSLHDLGTLSVEEGGELNVTGGTISAGKQDETQNAYAIYVYNAYSEKDVTSADEATRPYIEGKAAAKLSVSGAPTLGTKGAESNTVGGAIYIDKDVDVYNSDKHFAPNADISGYNGTGLDVVVSAERGFTDGQPVVTGDKENKTNVTFGGEVPAEKNSKKFIFRTTDGDVMVGGYDFTYEQTEPGKITVSGNMTPGLSLELKVGEKTLATLAGGENGNIVVYQNNEEVADNIITLDSTDGETGKFTLNGILTADASLKVEGDITDGSKNDVTGYDVYALFFDPSTANISGVTVGETQTFYKDKNGEFKLLTDGVLPNNIAIDEDGNATFRIGTSGEDETDERTITLGKRATAPEATQPTLTDLTDTSATFKGEQGLEYALKDKDGKFVTDEYGKVLWVKPSADDQTVTFEGLTEDSAYTIVARAQAGEGTIPGVCEEYANAATTLTKAVATAKTAFETAYEAASTPATGTDKKSAKVREALDSYDTLDKADSTNAATSLKYIQDKKAALEEALVEAWRSENSDALNGNAETLSTIEEASKLIEKIDEALSANETLAKVGAETQDAYFVEQTAQDVEALRQLRDQVVEAAKNIAKGQLEAKKNELAAVFEEQLSHLGNDEKNAALDKYNSAIQKALDEAYANVNGSVFPDSEAEREGKTSTSKAVEDGIVALERAHALAAFEEHYDEIVAQFDANGIDPANNNVDGKYAELKKALEEFTPDGENTFESKLHDSIVELDKAEAKDNLDAYLEDTDSDATKQYVGGTDGDGGVKADIDKLTSTQAVDDKVAEAKLRIEKNRAKEAVQAYYDGLKAEFTPAEGESTFDADNTLYNKYVKDDASDPADNPIDKKETINDVQEEQKRIEAALDLEAEKDRLAATVEATDPNKEGKLAAANEVLDDAVKAIEDGTTTADKLEDAVTTAKENAKAALDDYDPDKFAKDHQTVLDKYSGTLENVTKEDLDDINAALNDMKDGYTESSQESEKMDDLRDKLLEMKKKATKDLLDSYVAELGASDEVKAVAEKFKSAIDSVDVSGDSEQDETISQMLDGIPDDAKAEMERAKFFADHPSVAPDKTVDNVTAADLDDIKGAETDFEKLSDDAKAQLDGEAQAEDYKDYSDKLDDFRAQAELDGFKNKHPHIFGKAFAELTPDEKADLEQAAKDLKDIKDGFGADEYLPAKFEEKLNAEVGEDFDNFEDKLNDYTAQAEVEKFKEEHPVVGKKLDELTAADKQDIEKAIEDFEALKEGLDPAVSAKLDEILNGEAQAETPAHDTYLEKLNDMIDKALDAQNKTLFEEYKEALKEQLAQLAEQEGNGDHVQKALDDAKKLLDDVTYTPSAPEEGALDSANKAALDDAKKKGEDLIKHAGDKDEVVSALNANVQDKKSSGEYSDAQVKSLEGIVDEAKAQMDAVTTTDVVPNAGTSNVVENAKSKLDNIQKQMLDKLNDSPKTHATTDGIDVHGNVEDGAQENEDGLLGIVTNDEGIKGGITLHIDKVNNDAKRAIRNAINEGRFVAAEGTNMSEKELKNAIKGKEITMTLDIYLLKDNIKITEFNGAYQIKLLMTDELKGKVGLQVVYLNDETGVAEVFETKVTTEGDKTYLEFTTSHFSNFYVMSDPAINLWWLVIMLAVILFLECVAIVVLACRKKENKDGEDDMKKEEKQNKKSKQNRTYVSALPVLLLGAVIIPKSAVAICATLGALVVVAAIVIVLLLVSKTKDAKAEEEPIPEEETPQTEMDRNIEIIDQEIVEERSEEPVEEPVEEEQPEERPVEEEPAAAAATVEGPEEAEEEGNVDDLTEFMETGDASGRAYDARRKMFVLVRYDRSYTARLIQSDDKTKSYYDEIKGELMSYKGVKGRISWRHENFRIGRERVAKLQFRGKKLCLYLPLDPNDYVDSKYKIEDFSDVAKNKEVPLAYLIKNDLRARYAKELIAIVMARFGAEKLEGEAETYSQDYPYDTLDHLIGRKLIKVLMTNDEYEEAAADMAEETAEPIRPSEIVHEVKPEMAHRLISDERAEHLIEEGTRYADFTRKGFVNVDVLSRNFNAGEVVTLDEMKTRIKSFDKRVTFVKVLARGILDKPLIVEGDDFSIDAAKMILLTGGKVIRTKRK